MFRKTEVSQNILEKFQLLFIQTEMCIKLVVQGIASWKDTWLVMNVVLNFITVNI